MPSKSKKQHNFMEMIANNPAKAKELGVPQSVGKDFEAADKGKKFGAGSVGRTDLQKANKPKTDHGQTTLFKKGGKTMATKKLFGGKETFSEEKKEAQAVKSGKISPANFVQGEKSEGHKEEKSGKLAMAIKTGKMSPTSYAKMEGKEPKGMCSGGKAVKKMSKGGGIEVKGKTKGRMV